MKKPAVFVVVCFLAAPFFCPLAGEETGPPTEALPRNIERYEQVLLRRPEAGAAFDRVLEHYRSNAGIEALAARWEAKAGSAESDRAVWSALAGLLAAERDRTEEATAWYRKALDQDPSLLKARIELGTLLAREGEFDPAIEVLSAGLDHADDRPAERIELLRQLALTQERDFRTEEAVLTWKKIAEQAPSDSFSLEEAAEALSRNQDYETARDLYERLAEMAADNPYQRIRYRIRIARMEEIRGDYESALALYEEAMPKAGDTSWIQSELRKRIEEVYRKQENLPGLVEHYEKWIETRGPDSETALLLARVLQDLGRGDEATEWMRKAARWSPSRPDLGLLYAERLLATDKPSEAVETLHPLARAHPDDRIFQERLGDAYWMLYEESGEETQKEKALESWRRIAGGDPVDPSDIVHLASVLRRHEQVEEGLKMYRRAAEADPESVDVLEQWADWLFVLDRTEEAGSVLDQIVADGRESAERYLRLAQLRKRYEDIDGALEASARGLELDPDSFDLLSLRWSIFAETEQWEEAMALHEDLRRAAPNPFFRTTVDQRHITAIAAAGLLEETRDRLDREMEAGEISEDDLGLLLQIALETRDFDSGEKAVQVYRDRFADSPALTEWVAEFHGSRGEYDQQIAQLRKLISNDPKRKAQWLEQITGVQLDSGRYDDAIETAKERADLNPADSEAQLFLANVYKDSAKLEEAVPVMNRAIRLSEDPTPIRRDLIELLDVLGKVEEANEQAQALFESAESIDERLGTVPLLAEFAIRRGTLDDLIRDFERKRLSEEDGYRYALFLAAIYRSADDLGEARRNLIEALASRPDDPVLINQIIDLAREERATDDLVRFTGRLAEKEPSTRNLLSHLDALLMAERTEEAADWLERHDEKFLADLDELRKTLVSYPDFSESAHETLGEALQKRKGDPGAQIALGEMLVALGNYEGAKSAFWKVFEMRQPPSAVAQAPAAANPRQGGLRSILTGGASAQRMNSAQQARNRARQLILTDGNRHRSHFIRYGTQPMAPTFEEQRDAAMIFLAALAVKEGTTEEFLARIEKELDQRVDPDTEKMITFSLLAERERAGALIDKILDSGNIDEDTLDLCTMLIFRTSMYGDSQGQDMDKTLESLEKAQELYRKFNPQKAKNLFASRAWMLARTGKAEEARTIATDYLDGLEKEENPNLNIAVQMLSLSGLYERAPEILRLNFESPPGVRHSVNQYLLNTLPYLSLGQGRIGLPKQGTEKEPAEVLEIVTDTLEIIWREGPVPTPSGRSNPYYHHHGDATQFPGNSPWLDQHSFQMLGALHALLSGTDNGTDAFAEKLEGIAGTLDRKRAVSPRVMLAAWHTLDGNPETAARIMEELAAQHPGQPALGLLLVRSLFAAEQYEKCIQASKRLGTLRGPDKLAATILHLRSLAALERKEEAREVAIQYARANPGSLSEYRFTNVLNQMDLRNDVRSELFGAKPKGSITADLRSNDWNRINAVINRMQNLQNNDQDEEAAEIALKILATNPMATQRNNEEYLRGRALDTITRTDSASAVRDSLLEQLESAPDSAFLHFRLAELYLTGERRSGGVKGDFQKHVDEIIRLRPNDPEIRQLLANKLMSAGKHESAADLYKTLLMESPLAATSNSHQMARAFERADRVDELIEIVSSPAFKTAAIPSSGGSHQLTNLYQQIANHLQNENRTQEAIEIWKIALEFSDGNPHQQENILNQVLPLQVETGRIDDARETLWLSIFSPEQREADVGGKTFGFGQNNYHHNYFASLSIQNGEFTTQGLELLRKAYLLGLGERILNLAESEQPEWMGEPERSFVNTLIRIWQRDPSLLEELQNQTEGGSVSSPVRLLPNAHLTSIYARELEDWNDADELRLELQNSALEQMVAYYNSGNQHFLATTDIRRALEAAGTAVSESEIREATAKMKRALATMSRALRAGGNSGLPNRMVTALLAEAIRSNVIEGEEADEWIERIEKSDNLGGDQMTESAANYLSGVKDGFADLPVLVAFQEDRTVSVLRGPVAQNNRSYSDGPYYAIPPESLREQPILWLTSDPQSLPEKLSVAEYTRRNLLEILPDGYGYRLALGPGEVLGTEKADRWERVSLAENLIPHPNPASAPLADEDGFMREGWSKFPLEEVREIHFSDQSPIATGSKVTSGRHHQRSTFETNPIPLSGASDLYLEAWVHGLDKDFGPGSIQIGLTFLDKEMARIGRESDYFENGFADTWMRLERIYATEESSRRNERDHRGNRPERISRNAAFVQVYIEADPGVAFGGLRLVEIPEPAAIPKEDKELLNKAKHAAKEGNAGTAGDLFLEYLRSNPGKAVDQWPFNDEVFSDALAESGRLDAIFLFLSDPAIHNEDSFRYHQTSVRSRHDLIEAAMLAIASPEFPSSKAFLETIFRGDTCLEESQVQRLLLRYRADGADPAPPTDSLELGMSVLGFDPDGKESDRPSARRWEETLQLLGQLELLPTLLEELNSPDPPIPADSVDSLLVRAWILAPENPEESGEVLRGLAEDGRQLSNADREFVSLVLARMASAPQGMDPAIRTLTALSNASEGDEAQRARFRFETLKKFASIDKDPATQLLDSLQEAKLILIQADPNGNVTRLRELLKETLVTQDFETAAKLFDLSRQTSRHGDTIRIYSHVFPRLTRPDPARLWPVALAGPEGEDGIHPILIRFHPDNDLGTDETDGHTARVTALPLVESIPGLERLELRFGPFPNELETLAEFSGTEGSRTVHVELPEANGFLRAVARINGDEVPGPITPVFYGQTLLWDPEKDSSPTTDSRFSAFPPDPDALIRMGKTRRDYPEHPRIDLRQQDILLVTWAISEDSVRTLRVYPRYPVYDRNASNYTFTRTGEFTLYSALIPGVSGRNKMEPLDKIDFRADSKTRTSPIQFVTIDRNESEYLLWMETVRETAAKIEREEPIPATRLVALAGRDPYGSAAYLLPKTIEALLDSEDEGEALLYLRSLDPREASPFHQNRDYSLDVRDSLVNLLRNDDLPEEVRWEAALATYRIPHVNPVYRIEYLYEAAGPDPEKREFARNKMISWLEAPGFSDDRAGNRFRQEFNNFHTSGGIPHNHLNNALKQNYDAELDRLVREKATAAGIDLEKEPGKDFILTALLATPGQKEELEALLVESLGTHYNSYSKGLTTVVGVLNLEGRGWTRQDRQDLLMKAAEILRAEDPMEDAHDPPRGLIMVTRAILANHSQPPVDPMVETAIWITRTAANPKTSPGFLCSESSFALIDFLEESDQTETREQLLTAIREKAEGSRYWDRLNKRYPTTSE